MPRSSATKRSSSSVSDADADADAKAKAHADFRRAWWGERKPAGTATKSRAKTKATTTTPLVELRDVSLRFVSYYDKQYSLKRAALDLLLRREAVVPTSEFWALRRVNFT